jgi:hypothetical protein
LLPYVVIDSESASNHVINRIFSIRLTQEPRKEASYFARTNFVLEPSPHMDQTCICGERNRFAVPLRDSWLDETFLLVKVKKLSGRQQGVRKDWLTFPFPGLTGKPIPDATPHVRYIANSRTFVPYSAEYLTDWIRTGTTQRQELYVKFYAREQRTPEDELNIPADQGEKCYRCGNDRSDAAHGTLHRRIAGAVMPSVRGLSVTLKCPCTA